ncbi:putative FAD-dependent isoamyl alcohol oxidase [Jackrogersella minutella]|nr:putative FAD-dependent isoamyl alcohol oxidase [Jackrogersella minutella]
MICHFLVKALGGTCALALLARADIECRYIPGDADWPSPDDWSNLNKTIQGRLIETVPQASVCHTSPYSDFDATACETLKTTWNEAQIYETKPAEFMNGYYQNQSCDPFTAESKICDLGNYAAYSINVTGPDDVLAGIQFAKHNNIRLVIKSTGHDYNGKSTGKGALSLWMFNLKTTEIIDRYESDTYTGPAIKLGPGVIAGEAYEAAAKAGYRIVGGECASVSLAGGYTQGGGHSMLNSAYGTAADNVLEWEVVTANGEYLVATPNDNADLYWALSGGGGGTYGVVLSMTTKAYPDGPVASATLTFNFTDAANESNFWEAVTLWFQQLPSIVGTNNSVILEIENNTFSVFGLTLPDQTISDVKTLVAPFLADLDRLQLAYSFTPNISATFVDYFASILGPLPYGPYPPTEIWNSRLVPRSVVLNTTANTNLIDAFKTTVADGTFIVGCNVMNVANAQHPDNAILPAWRDAIALCNVNAFWDFEAPLEQNLATKKELVSVYTPIVEEATPDSGVYLNEIDPWYEGDWKQEMYGANYPRLLSIKQTYDPDYILYGHFAVGGDEFSIDGSGRLCRA